ncbi:MAG: hypothetical protein ABIF88_03955 [archaeon]
MRSEIYVLIVLFVALSLGIVSAQSSSITSDFDIEGCHAEGIDLAEGACSADGNYWCDNGELKDTLSVDKACYYGKSALPLGVTTACCPSGYYCESGTTIVCVLKTFSCGDNANKNDCDDDTCYWIEEEGGFCADRPTDFSCSLYETEEMCEGDFWNLGRIGFGTEACNEYFVNGDGVGFVAPHGDCKCVWAGSDCVLNYNVKPDISDIEIPKYFSCFKNFTSGFCINDVQDVSWTVRLIDHGIFPDTVLESNSLCTAGSAIRGCGEPVVRLPGFSFLALILSICMIGLYYVFRKEEF